MNLLDRHVTKQYFEALLVATVLVGGVFMGTSEYQIVMHWICNCGLEWKKAFLVSFLQIPSICIFALPAGTLIATILVLYRLNHDGELLALRVSGVSQTRLMMPFFALGLAASIFSFTLGEYVAPPALKSASRLLLIAAVHAALPVSKGTMNVLDPMHPTTGTEKEARLMLVGNYVGNVLQNVVILDVVENQIERLHWADSGDWQRGQWILHQGCSYPIKRLDGGDLSTSRFNSMVIDSLASKISASENCGPISEHKTMIQLKQLIESIKAKGQPVPPGMLIDFYRRWSQPLACFLLVMAAFPVAIGNHQRGKAAGMLYGGVLTTAFFLLQEISGELGYNGRIDPLLAAWLPTIAIVMTGMASLFIKTKLARKFKFS